MAEKCYREIQSHGQLAGVSPIEAIILLAVPIVLAPILTVLNINLLFSLALALVLYAILRLSSTVSGFDHGAISFILYHFVWRRNLSSFALDEHDYLRRQPSNGDKD